MTLGMPRPLIGVLKISKYRALWLYKANGY